MLHFVLEAKRRQTVSTSAKRASNTQHSVQHTIKGPARAKESYTHKTCRHPPKGPTSAKRSHIRQRVRNLSKGPTPAKSSDTHQTSRQSPKGPTSVKGPDTRQGVRHSSNCPQNPPNGPTLVKGSNIRPFGRSARHPSNWSDIRHMFPHPQRGPKPTKGTDSRQRVRHMPNKSSKPRRCLRVPYSQLFRALQGDNSAVRSRTPSMLIFARCM